MKPSRQSDSRKRVRVSRRGRKCTEATPMELANFSDDAFDLRDWANATLEQARAPDEPLEALVSTVVLKLQFLSDEINADLREASSRALSNLPKSIRHVEQVRKEGQQLQSKIEGFSETLEVIERNTGPSLEMLSSLDSVKSAMESCSNILIEAERLKKFSEEVDVVFRTNDFKKIAEQLRAMQHSLKVLQGLPQFQDHQRTLMLLQDRLEGQARPHVLQAFNNREVGTTQTFVGIFDAIDRHREIMQHYYNCRLAPLEQQWASFNIHYPDPQPSAFPAWLPSFYDSIVLLIDQERSWVRQVFEGDRTVLPSLLIVILGKLQPDFLHRINAVINGCASLSAGEQEEGLLSSDISNPLHHLITLYSITATFLHNIRGLLGLDDMDKAIQQGVERAIFAPYFPYQTTYPQLEKQVLMAQLEIIKPIASGFTETLKKIGDSIPRLLLILDSAAERCMQFTLGSEAEGLIRVLGEVAANYMQHLITLVGQLRDVARLSPPSHPNPSIGEAGATGAARAGPEAATGGRSGPRSSINAYNDWSKVEGGLQLLTATARLQDAFACHAKSLRTTLLQHIPSLYGPLYALHQGKPDITCIHLAQEPEKAKKLYLLLQSLKDGRDVNMGVLSHLLPAFVALSHAFVYDCMFLPVKYLLLALPDLPVWKREAGGSTLPRQFSPSPQSYITNIGEHLLTLPQQLDPLGSSWESIAPNIPVPLPPSTLIPLDPWGCSENESAPTDLAEPADQPDFAVAWISAVARGAMALYLDMISKLNPLSAAGCVQLSTDIKYLITILSALGIAPNSTLVTIHQLLTVEQEEYGRMVHGWEGGQLRVAQMIAALREISLAAGSP